MARPDDRRDRGAGTPRDAEHDAARSSPPESSTTLAKVASTPAPPLWEVIRNGKYADVTFTCGEQKFADCWLDLVGSVVRDFTAKGGNFGWGPHEAWSDRVPVGYEDELRYRLMRLWSQPCGAAA